MKKALDNQTQTAAQLVNSLPQPTKPTPIGGLGNNIDVKA
ncbi:MAG: YjfB family protein [Burkholderiales bacterium]